MAIPSWDELRTQAQQISSRRSEQESSNLTNQLLAQGLSGAFTNLFPATEKQTFAGQLSPTTGQYTPFQTPYSTGGSGLQQLLNRGQQPQITAGNIPLKQDEATKYGIETAKFGLERGLKRKDEIDKEEREFGRKKELVTFEAGLKPKDTFNTANTLRKEFIDRPEVKEFVTVNTQVKSMDALLNSALSGNMKNRAALDQGLITMYNKLTDPNSVVRESEYARTPENLPTVNRIIGSINKLKGGGAGLTNEDRQALVLGAKIIGNERGREFGRAKQEYGSLSSKYGIDPSLVVGTLPDFTEYKIDFGVPTTPSSLVNGTQLNKSSLDILNKYGVK